MEGIDKHYDCLIHTETQGSDMHACMLKYADRLMDAEVKRLFLENLESKGLGKRKDRRINKSVHGPCQRYFDEGTSEFIWRLEGDFARKMGYDKCCYAYSARRRRRSRKRWNIFHL